MMTRAVVPIGPMGRRRPRIQMTARVASRGESGSYPIGAVTLPPGASSSAAQASAKGPGDQRYQGQPSGAYQVAVCQQPGAYCARG